MKNIKLDPKISKDQIKFTSADRSFPHTKASLTVYNKDGSFVGTAYDIDQGVEFRVIGGRIFKIDNRNRDIADNCGDDYRMLQVMNRLDNDLTKSLLTATSGVLRRDNKY